MKAYLINNQMAPPIKMLIEGASEKEIVDKALWHINSVGTAGKWELELDDRHELNKEDRDIIHVILNSEKYRILNDTHGYPHYRRPLTLKEREYLNRIDAIINKLNDEL